MYGRVLPLYTYPFFFRFFSYIDFHRILSSLCYTVGPYGLSYFPANAEDSGVIPGLGRSPGEGNGNPLQYSCLGNPRDRGAMWAIVHGVTQRAGHNLATKQQVCIC